jgi:hypothetical protein
VAAVDTDEEGPTQSVAWIHLWVKRITLTTPAVWAISRPMCYLPKCWPRGRLKPVEEYPLGFCLVVSHEMLAVLPFTVVLQQYTLVTLGP